ncbi:peptidoglycan-binding protein LysM [Arthrobacter sp. MN05-02]|nr:peptidoglycan-binding protein LysM [Arthrobacter sp. MN05-02]
MKTSAVVQAGVILVCGMVLAGAGSFLYGARPGSGGSELEGALGIGLAALGMATLAWWVLALGAAVLAELLRRHGRSATADLAARCTPPVMRRLAAVLLGVNLLAVPAMASAAPGGTASVVTGPTGTGAPPAASLPGADTRGDAEDGISPYWVPTSSPAVADGQQNGHPPGSPLPPGWEPAPMPADGSLLVRPGTRAQVGAAEVVVAPGDSLWSIVAARLGPLATPADVAEAWPGWFAANRSVIGDDPSLLLPGQVLHAPFP